MKKIRWTLLLLALGIALPAGLIVQRAIASLELESVVRHEAVAERIFDEMERSLSDFLVREESRPPEDYAPASLDSHSQQESQQESQQGHGLRRAAFADAEEPFQVRNTSNVLIDNVRLYGCPVAPCMRIRNSDNVTLRDISFIDGGHDSPALRVEDSNNVVTDNVQD